MQRVTLLLLIFTVKDFVRGGNFVAIVMHNYVCTYVGIVIVEKQKSRSDFQMHNKHIIKCICIYLITYMHIRICVRM